MRLCDMTTLPKNAGEATIEFEDRSDRYVFPDRIADCILLPYGDRNRFFKLDGGRQFLFRYDEREMNLKDTRRDLPPDSLFSPFRIRLLSREDGAFVYFGGTDEKPFLTELKLEPFNAFMANGEQGFYDSLVPSRIRQLSEYWEVDPKRQGDIWAVPIPYDLQDLNGPNLCLPDLPVQKTKAAKEFKNMPLCNTRHRLIHGGIHHVQVCDDHLRLEEGAVSFAAATSSKYNLVICEGRIKAPDHDDLVLDIPHVIEQTAHLRARFNTD